MISKFFKNKKNQSFHSKEVIPPKYGVVATQHGKEEVIIPEIMQVYPDLKWKKNQYNTDLLGTFTGEVERKQDALTTAIEKAKQSIILSGADIGFSSEGSFGPHPNFPWVASDSELVLFYDARSHQFCFEIEISFETNYANKEIKTWQELSLFSEKVNFPSHGLILKTHKTMATQSQNYLVWKDMRNWEELEGSFKTSLTHSENGILWVETDMRAHRNPTRMRVIKCAAEKLVKRLLCKCPNCQMPGFGKTSTQNGLPCSVCGFPTEMVLNEIWSCSSCKFSIQKERRDHLRYASPEFCAICNP